jgi:ABC-type lipoprotein release transport system permease subunit
MLLKIAWRNIWRKRTRSLIIILAVTLGIWAGLFICSFMDGFMNEMMEDSINHYFSHIQMHNPAFKGNNEIQFNISQARKVLADVNNNPDVKAATLRNIAFGMAASPSTASGTKIIGINPVEENKVTGFKTLVKQGTYFEGNKQNNVLIGQKLAEKLKVKLHSKIVLTFAGQDGTIISGAFRVVGIYKTSNALSDAANVFVNADDLNALIGNDSTYHELAIVLKDADKVDQVDTLFKKEFPTLKVESWKELSPETATLNDYVAFVLWILMGVFMLGLAFAIVNTMLMAVMERTRELGMLMAIGMNKGRTFGMIMMETITLTFVGCPAGIGLSWLTIWYFGKHGISMAMFAKGLENFGMSSMVYPALKNDVYWQIAILVFFTALLAAIYPSIRAIRLKPAEAIRKI